MRDLGGGDVALGERHGQGLLKQEGDRAGLVEPHEGSGQCRLTQAKTGIHAAPAAGFRRRLPIEELEVRGEEIAQAGGGSEGLGEGAEHDQPRVHPEDGRRRRVAEAPELPGEVLAPVGAEGGHLADRDPVLVEHGQGPLVEAEVIDEDGRASGPVGI